MFWSVFLLPAIADLALAASRDALASALAPTPRESISLEAALAPRQGSAMPGAIYSTLYLGWTDFSIDHDGSGRGDESTGAWTLTGSTWSSLGDWFHGGFEAGLTYASFDYARDNDSIGHEHVLFALLGARAGFDDGDNRLVPYVRGGGAIDPFDSGLFGGDGHLGWYGGAGLEVRASNRWSLAIEYAYLFDAFRDDLTFDGLSFQLGYRY